MEWQKTDRFAGAVMRCSLLCSVFVVVVSTACAMVLLTREYFAHCGGHRAHRSGHLILIGLWGLPKAAIKAIRAI